MVNCTGVIDGRAHERNRKPRLCGPVPSAKIGAFVLIKRWYKPGIVVAPQPNWRKSKGVVWIGFYGRFHTWDVLEFSRDEYRTVQSPRTRLRIDAEWVWNSLARRAEAA